MLDLTKDIQPLTTFRRKSAAFLRHIKKARRPVVLTVNAEPQPLCRTQGLSETTRSCRPSDVFEAIRQGLATRPMDAPVSAECLPNSVESMAYHVEFTDRAFRDLDHLYLSINAGESIRRRVVQQTRRGHSSPSALPGHRCPVAPGK